MLFDFQKKKKRCQNIWLVLMQSLYSIWGQSTFKSREKKTMSTWGTTFVQFSLSWMTCLCYEQNRYQVFKFKY